jgi:hypothetical protein
MATFARFFGVIGKEYKNILTKMNKELTSAASLALGVRSYESPAVNVVEVLSEGVLCSSLTDGREGNFGDFVDGEDIF